MDAKDTRPIIGLVKDIDGSDILCAWDVFGKHTHRGMDLVIKRRWYTRAEVYLFKEYFDITYDGTVRRAKVVIFGQTYFFVVDDGTIITEFNFQGFLLEGVPMGVVDVT